MRSKLIVSEMAYPATATTSTSTAVLFVAANVGSVFAGAEAVPGEDMAFPSTGSGVAAIELEGVTANTGDTVNIQTSNNYYAVAGVSPTYANVATSGALTGLTTKSKIIYLDKVPFGEAMRVSITTTGTAGVGTVSVYVFAD